MKRRQCGSGLALSVLTTSPSISMPGRTQISRSRDCLGSQRPGYPDNEQVRSVMSGLALVGLFGATGVGQLVSPHGIICQLTVRCRLNLAIYM